MFGLFKDCKYKFISEINFINLQINLINFIRNLVLRKYIFEAKVNNPKYTIGISKPKVFKYIVANV